MPTWEKAFNAVATVLLAVVTALATEIYYDMKELDRRVLKLEQERVARGDLGEINGKLYSLETRLLTLEVRFENQRRRFNLTQ